jgi:hypothetical protein
MNDPHVDELHYQLIHDEFTEYADPPPLKTETEAFSLPFADGRAVSKMKEHCSTKKNAKRITDA